MTRQHTSSSSSSGKKTKSSSSKKKVSRTNNALEARLQHVYSLIPPALIPPALHDSLPPARTVATVVTDPTFVTALAIGLVMVLWLLWPRLCRGGRKRKEGKESGSSKKRKSEEDAEEFFHITPYGSLPRFEKGDFVNVFFGGDVGKDADAIAAAILQKKAKKAEKKLKKEAKRRGEEVEETENQTNVAGLDENSPAWSHVDAEISSLEAPVEEAPSVEEVPLPRPAVVATPVPVSVKDPLSGQTLLVLSPSMTNPDIEHPVSSEEYNEAVRELEASSGGSNFLMCKVVQLRSVTPGELPPQLVLRTPQAKLILVQDQAQSYFLDRQIDQPVTFVPDRNWREIPAGAVVESSHSVAYKLNLATGRNMARIA